MKRTSWRLAILCAWSFGCAAPPPPSPPPPASPASPAGISPAVRDELIRAYETGWEQSGMMRYVMFAIWTDPESILEDLRRFDTVKMTEWHRSGPYLFIRDEKMKQPDFGPDLHSFWVFNFDDGHFITHNYPDYTLPDKSAYEKFRRP